MQSINEIVRYVILHNDERHQLFICSLLKTINSEGEEVVFEKNTYERTTGGYLIPLISTETREEAERRLNLCENKDKYSICPINMNPTSEARLKELQKTCVLV